MHTVYMQHNFRGRFVFLNMNRVGSKLKPHPEEQASIHTFKKYHTPTSDHRSKLQRQAPGILFDSKNAGREYGAQSKELNARKKHSNKHHTHPRLQTPPIQGHRRSKDIFDYNENSLTRKDISHSIRSPFRGGTAEKQKTVLQHTAA